MALSPFYGFRLSEGKRMESVAHHVAEKAEEHPYTQPAIVKGDRVFYCDLRMKTKKIARTNAGNSYYSNCNQFLIWSKTLVSLRWISKPLVF